MPDKTWKARERKGAKLLGTTRNPLSGGGRSIGGQDSQHPAVWVESKYRVSHTAISVWKEAEKARTESIKQGATPEAVSRTIVLLSQRSTPGDFLLLRLQDFPEIQRLFHQLAEREYVKRQEAEEYCRGKHVSDVSGTPRCNS